MRTHFAQTMRNKISILNDIIVKNRGLTQMLDQYFLRKSDEFLDYSVYKTQKTQIKCLEYTVYIGYYSRSRL
jgi:hypothetical protein